MNPFMTRSSDGRHRCNPCNRWLDKGENPTDHAADVHRVGPDFLAIDEEGACYDLRGIDLPQRLREAGVV